MPSIAVLSDALIDQIAAGEVVERPASVVKELAENALDAGARSIQVRLEAGGARSIEVVDDGGGMSREDAVLSVRRHATSKLRTAEDLLGIRTLGFRGEALAAIGGVSRLILRTAERGAAEGTEVRVEAGGRPTVLPAATRPGTQVVVEDLFGAVPARRKFLRRPETEVRHVEEVVLRLALSHPEVAVQLDHDGRTLRLLPPSESPDERIQLALGPEVAPFLLSVDERRLGLRVHGFIASPEYTLSTARSLHAFVNGRPVRDRILHFAVHRGLSPLLPPGRQPVGVLFVELPPSRVDVNVHPQKLEVRFADAAEVTDAIQAAVGRAVRRAAGAGGTASAPSAPGYAQAVERFLSRATPEGLPLPSAEDRPPAHGEAWPDRSAAPTPGFFAALRPLGTLQGRALVCEGAGGSLVVLDLHAARERVLATRLGTEGGRRSAAPVLGGSLTLAPAMQTALAEHQPALAAVGFVLEPFGPESLRLSGCPEALVGHRPEPLLEAAVGAIRARLSQDEIRAAVVCAAAEEPRAPAEDEVRALLDALESASASAPVRHRRVVAQETPLPTLLP